MASKLETLKKTLASSRRRAKESAERSTGYALVAGAGYGAGYATGRYKDSVTIGEAADGSGGVNALLVGGGLAAAGAAVGMAPMWLGATGIGMVAGVLGIDGLAAGVKAKLANP